MGALEKCGELDADTKDKLLADIKFSQAYNILYTTKTEDGKACPLYRNNKIEKVKDTCASKACTSASIEAYKLLAEGKKMNKNDEATVALYENILKGLQECDGGAAASNTNNDANANGDNANGDAATTVAANNTAADANNANNANNANGDTAAANNGTQVSVNNTDANANANTENSGADALKYTMALVMAVVYLLF